MTTTYHAYANRPALAFGTVVLITGGSERVVLQSADELSIETPEYHRFSAVVVLRTRRTLRLRLQDGTGLWLEPAGDGNWSAEFRISDGFSRQPWVVVRRTEVTR